MADEDSKKNVQNTQENARIAGILNVTGRGVGYLPAEGFDEDIEIERDFINTALNKDTVEILLLPEVKGERRRGKVEKIIERAKTQFVGVLEREKGLFFLVPDNKRMYVDILIPDFKATSSIGSPKATALMGSEEEIKEGTKALVKLTKWDDPEKNPEGEIIKILGQKGEHNVEMESIILEQGFEATFPTAVEDEAKEIEKERWNTEEEAKKRKDFRNTTTFTIDPKTAKDFDDALSVKKLENGDVEVGVHIADVSHFVRTGSEIDKEARKRATSIYLVDRTIPMLPEALSNDVCSLMPNEDRLAYSAVFIISKNGEIKERWFGETLIHSDKRFTYADAQKILDDGSGEYFDELNILNTLAHILRKKRFEDGSIAFEHDEVEFELDEKGKPISIKKKKILDTNLLVEDFMLLANREVAKYFYKECRKDSHKNALFINRAHDVPDPEKIEELSIFLRAIGYELDIKGESVTAKEINELFERIEGKPEEQLIKTAAIRSMAKAVYSTKNIGHFGLAFKYYTHFTSPIRRYPDIMVHRILKSHLGGATISDNELKGYEKMATISSEREISATRAERDSIKYKQVEYMKGHIGEEFDGIVTGVTEWGIYVEDVNTKSGGMVSLRTMRDDFYTLDKKHYRLIGEKNKKKFSLGDSVRVKLISADLDRKTLDFVFV